jgi:hypothetical protein
MLIVHDEDVQRSIMQVGGWAALTLLWVRSSEDCAGGGLEVVPELCSSNRSGKTVSVCFSICEDVQRSIMQMGGWGGWYTFLGTCLCRVGDRDT